MSSGVSEIVPKPAHVPAALVRDFDFFALESGGDDVQLAWKRVQERYPEIFWTPRNGGHWVVTRGEDIARIQIDHEYFSQAATSIPRPTTITLRPINLDPPEQAFWRKLIMPAFLPRAVDVLESKARALAVKLIDELAPKGECEFMADFARKLPTTVFMEMVDLPGEDVSRLVPLAEAVARGPRGAGRVAAFQQMQAYLSERIEARRRNPGTDLISKVAQAEIDGRPLTLEEIYSVSVLLLFGGLDTVASMMGCVARFLALNPEHRRRLIDEPEITRNAIEELIRRHGISNTGRIIAKDLDWKGVHLKTGDVIQQPNCLYALDERINDDPLTVDFDRKNGRHLAFGSGVHTCPGGVLARRELHVFIEEWLARIPDFTIKPGTTPVMSSGMVNSVERMELSWEPR